MVKKNSKKYFFLQNISKNIPFENIPDIVRGHEVWLEHDMRNISQGDIVECDLCFGHNMISERAVEVNKVKSVSFDTFGENYDVDVSTADDHLLMRFTPEHEGYHAMVAEYNGGILDLPHPGMEGPKYYYQYTKIIIQVGHSHKENNLIAGHELEIVLPDYRQYKVGESILLRVLYDRHALPGVTVYAIHTGNQEDPIEVQTDHEGKVAVELEKEGKWMFKVVHRDPEKSVADRYDEKVMTATFTIMDIGE